ncbi:hypothetical protein [Azovibrio restrictus]|uniref:hypothetical protein n=1 Tax=Azovibrio restrictus TaxID=146938 RepID=UPI0026EC7928|nr:hypothetical protein [Azovibrio restrictus]
MKNAASEKQRGILADVPGVSHGGLTGLVELPAREVEFVERAYRSSLIWLGCTLVGTMSILGVGLIS